MKETKNYQVPELRVIDLKARLMQEVVPVGGSGNPDSFQAEFEEEDENSGSVEL